MRFLIFLINHYQCINFSKQNNLVWDDLAFNIAVTLVVNWDEHQDNMILKIVNISLHNQWNHILLK